MREPGLPALPPLDAQRCGDSFWLETPVVRCRGCGLRWLPGERAGDRPCPTPAYASPPEALLRACAAYGADGRTPPAAWVAAAGLAGPLPDAVRDAWRACPSAYPMGELLSLAGTRGVRTARLAFATSDVHNDRRDPANVAVRLWIGARQVAVTADASDPASSRHAADELRALVSPDEAVDLWLRATGGIS